MAGFLREINSPRPRGAAGGVRGQDCQPPTAHHMTSRRLSQRALPSGLGIQTIVGARMQPRISRGPDDN